MTKTVYWAPVISGNDWPLISELKFFEPERLIKRIDPIEFFGPHTARCPAMVNELKNTFALKSPIDLHIDYGIDFRQPRCFNNYDSAFLNEIITQPNPHKIFQLSYAQILIFSEDELTMTQLHPYYEDTPFTNDVMGVSGTVDISSWIRPVQPGFKFKKDRHTLNICEGEAVAYYRFNTEETVTLKRFDAKGLYSDRTSIMQACLSFKDHKPDNFAYSLKASYEAFKRAKFNKKMMKYINDNLLD